MNRLIGVVGAGVMGRGVTQNLVQTGHRVVLLDLSPQILEEALTEISENIRLQRLFSPDQTETDEVACIGRITPSTSYDALAETVFVIENATEQWEVKREIFAVLDRICSDDCPLAANTSAIPITLLASVVHDKSRVLGLHFMNPVPMIPTVEVVRTEYTSSATLDRASQLLLAMNKKAIVVNDSPGFIINRLLMLTINEAIHAIQEQVAPAADVDDLFKQCCGHTMGPLETADLIGLDTILYTLEILDKHLPGGKYHPCPLLRKMVEEGRLGRKSGSGFYKHPTI
jgi:3-hydroxybutyryl-CoA dehydrogenase